MKEEEAARIKAENEAWKVKLSQVKAKTDDDIGDEAAQLAREAHAAKSKAKREENIAALKEAHTVERRRIRQTTSKIHSWNSSFHSSMAQRKGEEAALASLRSSSPFGASAAGCSGELVTFSSSSSSASAAAASSAASTHSSSSSSMRSSSSYILYSSVIFLGRFLVLLGRGSFP